MVDADAEEFHDLSDYIVWMHRSHRKLKFDLPDVLLARAFLSDNRKLYFDYGANEFLVLAYTYNMMKQFIEFVDILRGDLDWRDATNFNTAFNSALYTSFPKYIFYSGKNKNVAALLRTFDPVKYATAKSGPASSV